MDFGLKVFFVFAYFASQIRFLCTLMSIHRRINIDLLIALAGLSALGILEFTLGDAIGWFIFILAIVLLVSVIVLLWKVAGWYGRRREQEHAHTNGDMLTALMDQIAALDKKIDELQAEIKKLESQRNELTRQAKEYTQLRRELEDKHVIQPPTNLINPVVLGVWPVVPGQQPLDQRGEADALSDSGYTYVALRGQRATRAGVILEVDRVRPTILQVGGHGNADGIMLTDGIVGPGWWGSLVQDTTIELVILLSCDSSQQDEINVSDALIRAGVPQVISCDSAIADVDAVKYCSLLYAKLSEGIPLATASRRAKLALSRESAEMIRLRTAMGART